MTDHESGHGSPPGDITVEVVRTREDMVAALEVRRAVFIVEQRVPEDEEIDAHDGDPAFVTTAVHVVARRGDRAIATGRLLLAPDEASRVHIGRVAVLASERRTGVGRAVMLALQAEARDRGLEGIALAAQLHAIPFYKRLGYEAHGAVFLDAGIEHRWMDLDFGRGAD